MCVCVCVCVKLSHSAVQQGLVHYKSTNTSTKNKKVLNSILRGDLSKTYLRTKCK